MKPICFMVMPFRRKPVAVAKEGAPSEVDWDRLWDAAFRPALEELGFVPVRADLESGAVIVKEMLNRLRHSDLVVADVSLPNGNVYYEVGIRHVAREKGCVLIAADWFKPLFDLDYVRTLTYPLPHAEVSEEGARAIQHQLVRQLPILRDSLTPYHGLIDDDVAKAFMDRAQQISRFQAELAEVRMMPATEARLAKLNALETAHAPAARVMPELAIELLYLIRDTHDWKAVRAFVESLPAAIANAEIVQEQYFLALSELGEHFKAIAGLEALIQRFGPTPERCGIIGGRYKRLYRDEKARREGSGMLQPSVEERSYVKKAITYYEQGMQLDLNEYYCACNLPGLLRERGGKEDLQRADAIDTLVVTACRRAQQRGAKDPFLPATLFGTAFRRGETATLEDIVTEIESGVRWRLGTTLKDARAWISQAPPESRKALDDILSRLRAAHGDGS